MAFGKKAVVEGASLVAALCMVALAIILMLWITNEGSKKSLNDIGITDTKDQQRNPVIVAKTIMIEDCETLISKEKLSEITGFGTLFPREARDNGDNITCDFTISFGGILYDGSIVIVRPFSPYSPAESIMLLYESARRNYILAGSAYQMFEEKDDVGKKSFQVAPEGSNMYGMFVAVDDDEDAMVMVRSPTIVYTTENAVRIAKDIAKEVVRQL